MLQVLPNQEEIYEMLSLLLGESIQVEYEPMPLDLTNTYVAIYANEMGEPGALCCSSVAFAAYAGGSITLLPVDATREAAQYDDMTEMMTQNLYEVMNICTRLVINDETPHLKLTEVRKYEEVAEIVRPVIGSGNRGDYSIDIPRYGSGKLAFFVI